jgi:ribosome-binding factor A
MPREIPRARRVAEQVQRTLAQLLLREVRDPRLAPLTITHVRVSPDLSHAWVHYTLLAGDSHDPLQREILDEAATYLRGPLARSLRLRVAPHLHFAPDEELERGNRLDDLIGRAVREDEARRANDATADDPDAHYDSSDDDADDRNVDPTRQP